MDAAKTTDDRNVPDPPPPPVVSQHMIQLQKDIFYLQGVLLLPNIPSAFLTQCTPMFQKKHIEQVFEERALSKLCGFPPCSNPIQPYVYSHRHRFTVEILI